jgi:hypothetical protein
MKGGVGNRSKIVYEARHCNKDSRLISSTDTFPRKQNHHHLRLQEPHSLLVISASIRNCALPHVTTEQRPKAHSEGILLFK